MSAIIRTLKKAWSARSKPPATQLPALGTSVPQAWRHIVRESDWNQFTQFGLTAKEVRIVPIGSLRVQHRSEWQFDHFLRDHPEFGPRSILGSPIFDMAELIARRGRKWALKNFRDTSYYAFFCHFDMIGSAVDWKNGTTAPVSYDDDLIAQKVMKFIATFESIQNHGYLGGEESGAIVLALETPFETLKFGIPHTTPPYEIWSGHHRLACLAALGEQDAKLVILTLAEEPGTSKPLDKLESTTSNATRA